MYEHHDCDATPCQTCAEDIAEQMTHEEWLRSFPIYDLDPWGDAPRSYL